MELNECSCGRLFRTAADYCDHLPCEPADLARVRAHPEYQAMLANLTNVQNRCTQLLEGVREAKRIMLTRDVDRLVRCDAVLEILCNTANPPIKSDSGPG